MPARLVGRLLPVLAAAAGCLDVFCFARLGGAFASVVTGNLIQLGRGIADVNGGLAVPVTVAVGSYALGVAAANVALGQHPAGWGRRTGLAASCEWVLLAGVAAGWLAADGQPDARGALLLLVPASTAMGVQSIVALSSGVPGASTTYFTGTLTRLVRAKTGRPDRMAAAGGGAVRLLALLCGAVAGALLLRFAPLWTPLLPVVLVAAVVAVTVVRSAGAES